MKLSDPATLKSFLGRHNISASKGLGQHFLVSESVTNKIKDCFVGCEGVLEIGPGPGVLTGPISLLVQRMIALELDPRMVEILTESAPMAQVRSADALEVDLKSILDELPNPRGVVSNLPYYITGPLLTRIAEVRRSFSTAVLMMQKEVGERVLAPAKTSARGSLSVYLQSQFDIRKVAVAPAGAFMPPPKVDSVVLEFRPNDADPSEDYLKFIRLAFTQPRKTLINNLLLRFDRESMLAALESSQLLPTARPQELTLAEWERLYKRLMNA